MRRWSLLLAALLLLTGCIKTAEDQKEPQYFMYYLSSEENRVIEKPFETEAESAEELIAEMISAMNGKSMEKNCKKLLPENLQIVTNVQKADHTLQLGIHGDYGEMSRSREVLVRAGIVRTFTQIEGVSRVLLVDDDGEPLKDSAGNPIGAMSKDSFVENAGKEINNYQYTTLTLYFANETGNALVAEKRSVYYSTSMPLERVVIEQLMKGPREGGHFAVFPADTNILSVATSENTAYINFDKTFTGSVMNLKQEIPIYAIVNSLTTNCPVQKVQISINGESDVIYRESMNLNQFFEKDLSYIEGGSDAP